MEMQWWIWLVFGIVLILLELALPTFFILWFGIGAVLVSLASLAAPNLQLNMQVLLWVLLSSIITALWFRRFRSKPDARWTADSEVPAGERVRLTAIEGNTARVIRALIRIKRG